MADQVVAITLSDAEQAYLCDLGFSPGTGTEADVWPFPSETILRKLWGSLPMVLDV